jgi:hypothetical protein
MEIQMSEQATAEVLEDQPAEVVEEKTPESAKPVTLSRWGLLAEHANTWRVNCKIETTPEQCLDPSYWEHISKSLNRGDEIHVMPDDMSWELVLHVQDTGPNWAHVIKKVYYELAPSVGLEQIASVYKIEWAGSTKKFRVLREGTELKAGFATEAIARMYAAQHEKAVRR